MLDIAAWLTDSRRRFWAVPLVLIALGILVVLPADPAIGSTLRSWGSRLGGDIRRAVETWQQFGDVVSVIVIGVIILLLDPRGARRLPDLVAATGFTSLAALVVKVSVGRPRPKYDDPFMFLWPGGVYPITPRDGGPPVLAAAWESATRAELWSMPSSHTSAAAALSVFVATVYPRLRWLAVAMVAVVMAGRTMIGAPPAHWPSDVVIGAAIGWLIAGTVMRFGVGCGIVEAIGRMARGRTHAPSKASLGRPEGGARHEPAVDRRDSNVRERPEIAVDAGRRDH
ncbi:MAG: hypothetical protein AMXMBFR58_11990 [Phycisphaerae bacterium]